MAKELEQLDARLASQPVDQRMLRLHLAVACDTLQTLLVLSRPLQLPPRQLGELACSLVIVLRAGRQLLRALLADWQACSRGGTVHAAEAQRELVVAVTAQLHCVGGVVQTLLMAGGMEAEQLFALKVAEVEVGAAHATRWIAASRADCLVEPVLPAGRQLLESFLLPCHAGGVALAGHNVQNICGSGSARRGKRCAAGAVALTLMCCVIWMCFNVPRPASPRVCSLRETVTPQLFCHRPERLPDPTCV